MDQSISIIMPAKNESQGLQILLPALQRNYPDTEIIVVDDGSTDNTAEISRQHNARVISHVYSMGNGAAIKTGARNATGQILVFMDADGQHDPDDISTMQVMTWLSVRAVSTPTPRSPASSVTPFITNSLHG
jgi:glycosyltransferase involved in cell wall biosynthesis